jgi:hypothetical protein
LLCWFSIPENGADTFVPNTVHMRTTRRYITEDGNFLITRWYLIASYYSQGDDGGILTRLHMGYKLELVEVKVILDRRSVGQSVLVWSHHQSLWPIFHSPWHFLDSCGFVILWRLPWRETIFCCCWASPAQSLTGLSPTGLNTIFCCPISWDSQHGGPGVRIYIPQEQGGPIIPPGTEFRLGRILRLAGLLWRYFNPSPYSIQQLLITFGTDSIENPDTENIRGLNLATATVQMTRLSL